MTVRDATIDLGSGTVVSLGTPTGRDVSVFTEPADVTVDVGPVTTQVTSGPVVTETFPDSGVVDRVINPGATQSQIDAIQAGEIVEFIGGTYGDRNLNSLAGKSNVYAFCRATMGANGTFGHKWSGTPASFQHGHDGVCYDHPFAWNVAGGSTLRGMAIRGYSPNVKSGTDHRGSGVCRSASGAVVNWWDLEVSRSRESAFMPTGPDNVFKRVAMHTLGRYAWGAQVADRISFDEYWVHDVATAAVISAGLVPEQTSSDEGVCKMPGTDRAEVRNGYIWDISGMGVWWDGAGTNGVVSGLKAKNVTRNVVNLEVDFGPYTIEDIEATDCSNASSSNTSDVIRSVVLWPLTPNVVVRRVTATRCGNGVTTHNRNHNILNTGGLGYSAAEVRARLGVRNSEVYDCDFSAIEGGSGSLANRYNAGWAGGQFTHSSGDIIPFEAPNWHNNTYSPNARFRAGNDIDFPLSRWQSVYGMS